MIRGGTTMTPAMRAYLRASGVAMDDADEESDDPVIRGYENARMRAVALGMKNADQSPGGGLLHTALKWVDTPRAVVYGIVNEGINALEGEGFDTNRMWNTIDRGRNEGEGFGKMGVLRTTKDDPFWERALKFVPAAVLDMGLDPTNYVTLGTSTVPKTAVGQVARSAAKGALDDVIRAAGREAGEGLAREAGESVVADLAKRQLRYSGGVLDEAITPTLRQGEKEAVRDLAAERLADVIGTARVAGTGRTVTAALRQELLDLGFSNVDELALQVTRNLPRELRGGLGLEVPFTRIGTPLTRGGGAGTNAVGLGRAADLYNEVRLAGRARLRGQESLLTKLSGESGQMYGTVLRDIRQQEGNLLDGVNAVLRTPGKASADDLAAVVESNIRKRVASGKHVALANSSVEAARRAIAEFGDDNSADNIFRAAFHQHNLDEALQGFSRDEARVARLITAADQMRAVFEQAAERRGLKVSGNRDYVPRLVTVDEYNYRKRTSPAGASTVGDSDSMRGRYAYEELEAVLDDEGVMRLVGRDLSVPEINEASGRKVFEDNPFIIIARQTDKDVRSIEAVEVASVLRERGLLTRDPRTRAQTVGEVQKDVRDAAKKLSRLAPEMSENATGRASAAAEALSNAQNERTVARSAGAAARQNAADAAVQVREELAIAERQWTEANAAVRRLEGQLRRAQAAQDITEKRRIQQQLSRARKKRVKVDKDLKNARRRLRAAEKRVADTPLIPIENTPEYRKAVKQLKAAQTRADKARKALDEKVGARKISAAADVSPGSDPRLSKHLRNMYDDEPGAYIDPEDLNDRLRALAEFDPDLEVAVRRWVGHYDDEFADFVGSSQHGENLLFIRDEAEKILRGEVGAPEAAALLRAINSGVPSRRPLYRGMSGEVADIAEGATVSLPVGAFSDSIQTSMEYSGARGAVFELPAGTKGLPIEPFSPIEESEFLVSGTYRVVRRETRPVGQSGRTVEVTVLEPVVEAVDTANLAERVRRTAVDAPAGTADGDRLRRLANGANPKTGERLTAEIDAATKRIEAADAAKAKLDAAKSEKTLEPAIESAKSAGILAKDWDVRMRGGFRYRDAGDQRKLRNAVNKGYADLVREERAVIQQAQERLARYNADRALWEEYEAAVKRGEPTGLFDSLDEYVDLPAYDAYARGIPAERMPEYDRVYRQRLREEARSGRTGPDAEEFAASSAREDATERTQTELEALFDDLLATTPRDSEEGRRLAAMDLGRRREGELKSLKAELEQYRPNNALYQDIRDRVADAETDVELRAAIDNAIDYELLPSNISRSKKDAALERLDRNIKRNLDEEQATFDSLQREIDEIEAGYLDYEFDWFSDNQNFGVSTYDIEKAREARNAEFAPLRKAVEKADAAVARAQERVQAVTAAYEATTAPARAASNRAATAQADVARLSDTGAMTEQRIDGLTQRLSVLDERIADPTDPASLRTAERLAQFSPEQLDEIERITTELDRLRNDATYKAQEVAKLKAERNQLNLEARRNVPAERQTKLDEKKAAGLAKRAAAAQAAAQGAERELIESVKRINAIVEEGGWEEASQLFTELATRYRGTGAPKSVRETIRDGKRASELLGMYRSQDAVFSRLSAERGLVPLGNEAGRAAVPMAFDKWMAGQGISDALDTMYRLSGDGAGLRKALAPYLDPYMRLFKTWATVGRGPGYHSRNFIGGMINNWLLGVRVGAVSPAFRISRSIERTMKAVDADVASGKVLASRAEAEFTRRLKKELNWQVDIAGTSAYDVARGFLAEGVQYSRINEHIERAVSDKLLNAGTFAERKAARTLTPDTAAAVRRGGDGIADMIGSVADSRALTDNAWLRANVWAAEESERALRLAAYIEGYGRYGDQVSASLFARSAHFDYQDLTETERSLKMLVPFYTWTRNNIPFQLRQVINRPGSIQRLDTIADNLQAAFGDPDSELTPEWMGRRMGFETPVSLPGGGKLAVLMESPQLDLFAMFGDDGLNPIRMDEIAESLGPIVRGGFETVTGRDMTTGQEADRLNMLRNLVPPAAQAIRLGGLTERDRERALTSWAGFLTGAPVATVTERSRRSEARRRTEQLSPRIKEALAPYLGEGEEIDSKWLQEVGTTNTPERVLQLIEQGYGRKGGPKSGADVEGMSPAMRAFLRASS